MIQSEFTMNFLLNDDHLNTFFNNALANIFSILFAFKAFFHAPTKHRDCDCIDGATAP